MSARRWFAVIAAGALALVVFASRQATLGAPKTMRAQTADSELLIASRCGVERWPVKTGTDADRAKVQTKVLESSVTAMTSEPKPSHYPRKHRIAPVELHIWRVFGHVTQYREDANGDIHLVLKDRGKSMIAAIPAPSCVGSKSHWRGDIKHVRANWTHKYALSTSWHHINQHVEMRGLGFFDPPHGQIGHARNGVELHPVVELRFIN